MTALGRCRFRGDDGSALVEFCFLGVLLLIPLVYVLTTAFIVQRTGFALTAASREAGRVFVQANSGKQALRFSKVSAQVTLRDQGVDPHSVSIKISCASRPCLSPGARVDLALSTSVVVPFAPAFMKTLTSIPMTSHQSFVVDVYRQARP